MYHTEHDILNNSIFIEMFKLTYMNCCIYVKIFIEIDNK